MTKNVSLADDAYEGLAKAKRGGESFSEVVRRLTQDDKDERFMRLAGAWSHWTDEEVEDLLGKIRSWRDETLEPRVRFE